MKYSYYPGCSLHSLGREYDMSFRAVCSGLGISLEEVRGWTCCGTSSAHTTSRLLSVALPAGNLAKAETEGHREVVVPCASCFSRFKTASHEIESNPKIKAEIGKILGRPFSNSVKTTHPLEIIDSLAENPASGAKPARDMSGIKAVCYYGCLLTRPPKVTRFDNCEYPMSMDRILGKFGIKTLDWSYKTDCCGAGFGLTRPDIVRRLVKKILDNASAVGANAVAVACPLCHANLDARQLNFNSEGEHYDIPVFYFTQLVGLAMGVPSEKLGLKGHMIDTGPLVETVK